MLRVGDIVVFDELDTVKIVSRARNQHPQRNQKIKVKITSYTSKNIGLRRVGRSAMGDVGCSIEI